MTKAEYETLTNKLNELSEDELTQVIGGKNTSINELIKKLYDLINDYPEIVEIIESYNKNDFAKALNLLQDFFNNHPDLSYLFED